MEVAGIWIFVEFIFHPWNPIPYEDIKDTASLAYQVWLTWYHQHNRSVWCSAECLVDLGCFGTTMWQRAGELTIWDKIMKVCCCLTRRNATCFWSTILIGMRKNALARAIAACHVLQPVLIFSGKDNHIWHINCNWGHYLIKFIIVHCYPTWFL